MFVRKSCDRVRQAGGRARAWALEQAREHPSRLAIGSTVVVIAAIVLGSLSGRIEPGAPSTPPSPTDIADGASPSPLATWQRLDLPPYRPTAEFVPQAGDAAGIDPVGSLLLRSLDGSSAVDLAAGLRAQPAASFTVEPGATRDVAIVHPVEPLLEATQYRFELLAPDGSLAERWTYRTAGPLHVVSLIPDDRTTQVPSDTGIELEFDHEGAVGVPEHFSIEPSVAGRFEQHGRTWVFIPTTPLQPSTLYRVKLSAGVRIADSGSTLEHDVLVRFETAAINDEPRDALVSFERPIHDLLPDEAPVIPLSYAYYEPDAGAVTTEATVELYQLPELAQAVQAVNALTVDLSWATWSSTGNVPTDALELVATVQATVTGDFQGRYMRLPGGLAAGWYLLEVVQQGRHAQVVLQVTDLAAYTVASETRTVAWVNDLGADSPVANAVVTVWDGATLGQTGADGLLDKETPAAVRASLAAGDPTSLVVSAPDGRRLIAPLLGEATSWYRPADAPWWLLFGTDRLQYRRTDTIHSWGLVRSRASGQVPTDVELRLMAGYETSGAPIARMRVEPTSRGSFVASLPVSDLPLGQYQVALVVEGAVIGRASVTIADIRKPVFRIGVTTNRHVYVDGEQVTGVVSADFYDGSPAPALRLRLDGSAGDAEVSREIETGSDGTVSFSAEAVANNGLTASGYLGAMPALPEEGSSQGQANLVVLPAAVWLTADASLSGEQLIVGGRVAGVDRTAAEQQFVQTGWVSDPSGAPVDGAQVSIRINRITWMSTQTGTTYDFLLKKVVPLYRYDQVTTAVGTFSTSSKADGTYQLTLPVEVSDAGYEVRVSAADRNGRRFDATAWAMQANAFSAPVDFPYLQTYAPCGYGAVEAVGIDDDVELTVFNGDGTPLADGPTLFVTGRLGVEGAVVADGPRFDRRFGRGDLPSLSVRAVRLTPSGYVVTNDYLLRVLEEDTAIGVELTPDAAIHRPGDSVSVAITTTGPDGRRMPADVIVRAVDMKLYSIGAAQDMDVSALMRPVSGGFLASYASHRVTPPRGYDGCGGGATTGGGGYREDFADLATFQLVQTDADGAATARFQLPDDLTSWGVSATALADGLEAGTSVIEMPASLPFFVDSTIASEYLVGEEPVIQLRAFGQGLGANDRVRFTIAAPSLGVAPTSVEAAAFEYARVPFPPLLLGNHRITIDAERVGNAAPLRDRVARTMHVVPTRLGQLKTALTPLVDGMSLPGGDGLTTLVISDAGRGSLLGLLQSLAWGANARFDTSLAAELARRMLIDDFGYDEATLPGSGFDVSRAGFEGLRLLPYASANLYLTARVALVAPDRMVTEQVRFALRQWADDPEATRERRIVALAGLAGLGDDVLGELREMASDDLVVQERLWLALGLAAGGDENAARSIERSILTEQGRRFDRWVRLDVDGNAAEDHQATATMLLLAAQLRDPIAIDISRYLVENPSVEVADALEQAGFLRSAAVWLPRPEARFAWTTDGERHVESLAGGRTVTLMLTAEQRRSLGIERLDGELAVSASWIGSAIYDELPVRAEVSIERTVTPADAAPADGPIQVRLSVEFDPSAPAGCYQVTDVLPSGLAPLIIPWNGSEEWGRNYLAPYEVEGQRVSWCIDPRSTHLPLGYAARVVTPGTYRWEPAVVQSVAAPSIGDSTKAMTYTIR